jgi:hypothetical protein
MAGTVDVKFFKETALPATPVANAVYFITGADASLVDVFVTSTAGVARRVINKADIQAMITASIASSNELVIVADIAARDALVLTTSKYVFVKSAAGDTTVASGAATYLYDPAGTTPATKWIKVSEAESLDVQFTWAALTGKPSATAAAIDAAVSASHTHANKTSLDKVGQDAGGNLTYSGQLPSTGWNTTAW